MTNTNTTSRPFPGQKSKTGRKSASFHGRLPTISDDQPQIPRPESHPELLRRLTIAGNQQLLPAILPENAAQRQAVAGKRHQLPVVSPESAAQKLTKLLLNVMIQGSLGPVHVVMSPENTVEYLIKAAVDMYVKEGRRPLLAQTDPRGFDLHYSQFSLESLNPKEKLIVLGSRNFFLCLKPATDANSCSDQAKKASKSPSPLLRFMDFLL